MGVFGWLAVLGLAFCLFVLLVALGFFWGDGRWVPLLQFTSL